MLADPVRERRGREHQDHEPSRNPISSRNTNPNFQKGKGKGDVHVRPDPSQHDIRPRIPIMIRLLRRRISVLLLLRRLDLQRRPRRRPEPVHVLALRGQLDLHNFLPVLAFHFLGSTEILGGAVVTLRTPGDIVKVAHGVHHEDVDVCRAHDEYGTKR